MLLLLLTLVLMLMALVCMGSIGGREEAGQG